MATNADKPAAKIKRVRRTAKKAPAKRNADAISEAEVPEEVVAPPKKRVAAPTVTAVAPDTGPVPSKLGRVRRRDITLFLRQLIMLLDAGTPLLKSLQTLSERLEGKGIRAIVSDVARHVEGGNALWQAFERHPHSYFDTVFVNLVKASEASGTLVDVLRRQTEYYERRNALARRVKSALVYPVVLVAVAGAVLVLMAKFVIPAFEEVFIDALGKELSGFPAMVIGLIKLTVSPYMLLVLLVVVALVVVYRLWRRNPVNRLRADRFWLRVPLVGNVAQKYAVSQMSGALSMLLRSGMSMMVTLDLARNAIRNQAVAQVLQAVRDSVEQGGGLEEPLRAAPGVIPPVVTDMLVTGEESGQLDQIAEHISVTYEEEVKQDIDTLTDLLPPVLVIGLGLVVLTLVLGFFLPLIEALGEIGAG